MAFAGYICLFTSIITGYKVYYKDCAGLIEDENQINDIMDKMYPITEYGNVGFYVIADDFNLPGDTVAEAVITEAEAAKDFRRIPFYITLYAFTYLK